MIGARCEGFRDSPIRVRVRARSIAASHQNESTARAESGRARLDWHTENACVYITTSPNTNSSDGQYARIGISRGIGNRAFVVADRMAATAFVELNADDTPIGLLTVQKDLRVIKSSHAIDPFGKVFAPSQSAGVCTRSR